MIFSRICDYLREASAKRIRFLMLIASGILTGLTLVFTKIGLIEWITLVPMGIVLLTRATDRKVRLRSLFLDGLIYFYSFFLVCYHWFVFLYPLEFIDGMTKGLAVAVVCLAWLGLSLLQALMGGVAFVACGVIFRCRLCEKFNFLRVFVVAGAFAVFEWFQTVGWWAVPWGRLALGQTEYLVGLQTASLFGPYFVSFIIVAVNLLLAYVIVYPNKLKLGCITAASLLVFQYGVGTILWVTTDVTEGEPIKISCLQGNISSNEKWDNESAKRTRETYLRLIDEAVEEGAELIILPETAFPYNMDSSSQAPLNDLFCELAHSNGVYLLVGAFSTEGEKDSLNSLICYTPEGVRDDTVYSKRHLVPFGEYVPMRPLVETLLSPLANLVLGPDAVDEGEGTKIIDIDGVKIGGIICFDSVFEELTRDSVLDGAQVICLGTDDSWFGNSAELHMHNAQSQLRAIETRRYVARAANTGVSTIIDSRGEVIAAVDPVVDGKATAIAYASSDITLYSRIGNAFVYLLIIIAFILILENFVNILCRSKKKKQNS